MSRSVHKLLSKTKALTGVGIGAIAMLAMAVPAMTQEAPQKDEVFQLTAAIGLNNTNIGNNDGTGSTGFFSFDISWVDPVLNQYFLADRSNKSIDVVDTATLAVKQFVNTGFAGATGNNDTSGPDGVLTANNHTELWVGDSPGRVWVLAVSNGAVKSLPSPATNPISVGGTTRADELCYDPTDNLIMIASPGEGDGKTTFPFVTFISTAGPKAYTVVGKLTFDGTGGASKATGGLEQCGWSPTTGKFYQNVPVDGNKTDGSGAVAVINPKTMKVEQTFPVPIDACGLPQGMAIGPHNQILLGCNGPSPDGHRNIAIINQQSGSVLRVLPDLGGADEVWFNEGDFHYIIPNCNTACRAVPSTGKELLGIVDANGLKLDHTVDVASTTIFPATGKGAARRIHSVAADPKTNRVFLPVPAIGGGNPEYAPTLCSSAPTKVGSPTDASGCIAVFAAPPNNDRPSVAQERGMNDHQQ